MTRKTLRATSTLIASGFLVAGLAACSSSGGSTSTSTATGGSSSSAEASSSAPSTPLADIPSLTGQSTSVALSTGFTTALTTLGLTPGLVGTATMANGSLTFPITGGDVQYYQPGSRDPYVTGSISHQGSGLTLTGGSTVVTLENLTIDPGGSKLYGDVSANGTSVGTQLYLFNLDGSTLQPLQTSGTTATLTGTRVLVSPDAAALLNQTFMTTAVTDTLEVGIATIVVNTG